MDSASFSLIPPLLVLVLGYLTRNVLLSLGCGVVTASFIICKFNLWESLCLSLSQTWSNLQIGQLFVPGQFWECKNLFIFAFLIILGIIISYVRISGGAQAYAHYMGKRLKDRKSAETSTLLLSTLLFVDDYFSSLTVGSVMSPVTDRFRIARVKLAFLVDSMAAPLAILCPFSSWFAAIIGFLTESGISNNKELKPSILMSPFYAYLDIFPYIFYSFIIIFSAWYIVRRKISFGLMAKHEKMALESKPIEVSNYASTPNSNTYKELPQIKDFAIPVITLCISVIGGMLFSGGYWVFGGSAGFFEAFQNCVIGKALFSGGVFSLLVTTLYFLFRKKITILELPRIYLSNCKMMFVTIMVLTLAWTFGDLLRDYLYIGNYLASLMVGNINAALLPVAFFATALAISFAIGSSWGGSAITLPIAIPALISFFQVEVPCQPEQIPLLFPVLGAIFSGAIAGDHISPISDTTIMSALSTGCNHMDHVKTQMTYAIPVILATVFGFTLLGTLVHKQIPFAWGISIIAILAFIWCILEIGNIFYKKTTK